MNFSKLVGMLGVALVPQVYCSQQQAHCNSLKEKLHVANATVWFTEYVPSGTNLSLSENDPSCALASQVIEVDICRVALLVGTSVTSNISMEAWLPFNWTGRFLSTGNGGLGGCIDYAAMAYTAHYGFASVGANNGHNGTSGALLYKNPGALEDFAYRSLHTGVVVGKQVTKAFYDKAHTKSYYLGCSTGGRQGFKEAQDFPNDFDGIVAGSPALNWNNLVSWAARFINITGVPGSPDFIPLETWQVIGQAVLHQCDALDGVIDCIIENTNLCQYRPEALICASSQTHSCLTGAQAKKVRDFFSPLYGPNNTLIFPRVQPGMGMMTPYVTGLPFAISTQWFQYVVHEDPSWNPTTISFEDFAKATLLDPFQISTWKGDLSGAMNSGTKILSYHGEEDILISPESSTRYYDHVSRTMGLQSGTLDSFYRLFIISGMNHCVGGTGASFIGNMGRTVVDFTPEKNVLAAMVRWVENGTAPDTILGTAYVNGTKASGQIAFQRNHCRYPFRNVYRGEGDPDLPENWKCI
ncbi:feruloyl esterase b [Penicillium argentinense]|uniref:Carboxylic ester hydrolase n=1 Tax=Penicillium argentinense TaxID=1131581 RepID=A0A9W9G2X9_9EURO|nr:feruloyl esterase b [Penicillium argentinense]KAJ5110317.1 feruloyl esterase b [Penicillium argentinense]